MDRIRVLRVIEYEGPRDRVEATVAQSIHEARIVGVGAHQMFIRAATVGTYPEILGQIAEATIADIEHDMGGES